MPRLLGVKQDLRYAVAVQLHTINDLKQRNLPTCIAALVRKVAFKSAGSCCRFCDRSEDRGASATRHIRHVLRLFASNVRVNDMRRYKKLVLI